MRKIPVFFVLAILAVISFGCGNSDQSGAANSNAPGTTTYSNSSVPVTTNTTAAPSGGGASTGATAPKASPTAPGIKPPTDK